MTSPEQRPPAPALPADAQRRMRERLLAEIAGPERARRRTWTAPVAVAASVLLAGGGFTAIRALTGSPPPPTAATTSPAPTVIDCGTVDLGLSGRLPQATAQCLIDAASAGTPAHLQQTENTDEGDPIITTFTVEGKDRVRVVTDMRADRFGPKQVQQEDCTQLREIKGRLMFDSCTKAKVISK
ncbi:DUF4362 domain-containing protein [Actinoplanes sp. HUAS TT8]|uniref:DUF4362 domain-containing protein n=1 Tax=Actinoplanes sp. HUAS TT8 TaxID=3447453 RepID=UPI003F5223EA